MSFYFKEQGARSLPHISSAERITVGGFPCHERNSYSAGKTSWGISRLHTEESWGVQNRTSVLHFLKHSVLGGVLSQQDAEARMIGIVHQCEESEAGLWAVFEREQGDLIGLCGLGMFESETEVIYKFFPAFWGRGYATEAAVASLAYGFQTLQLDRIIGVTQEANQGSQRVLEKLGMHHVRTLWKWEAVQRVYELDRTAWLTQVTSYMKIVSA